MNRQNKMYAELEEIGYEFDRKNSKGIQFWIHPDTGAEIKLLDAMDDNRCQSILWQARQAIGLPTKDKRNAGNIKERNSAARDAARLAVEKAKANLVKYREANNEAALRQAAEILEQEERRFRYWDRLMRTSSAA